MEQAVREECGGGTSANHRAIDGARRGSGAAVGVEAWTRSHAPWSVGQQHTGGVGKRGLGLKRKSNVSCWLHEF